MNEKSRDKKKFLEIISKNRLIFALVGSVVAIIAFFTPMFYLEDSIPWIPYYYHGSLWIFGLYERSSTYGYVIEWFGNHEGLKLGISLISIVSTIITSALVLGTLFTASKTLIKKRKNGVYSSRLILYFSLGLFVAVNLYMFVMRVYTLRSAFAWVGNPTTFRLGAYLFYLGSVLILLGYTVKLKPLLKIVSLFVAGGFIHFGALYLAEFFWVLSISLPIDPPYLIFHISGGLILAIIYINFALAIVIVNYKLYRRAK